MKAPVNLVRVFCLKTFMNIPMPRQQLRHEHLHVCVLHRESLGHILVSAVHDVVRNWRTTGRTRILNQTKNTITIQLFPTLHN